MERDYKLLEEDAHSLLAKGEFAQAYKLFKKAAEFHRTQGNLRQAALCYASAASCWGIKSGEKTFYEAAVLYEEAARAAQDYRDFEYASLLYKYAAINYERDGEFWNFSECFYLSKEIYRKFLAYSLRKSKKIHHIVKGKELKGARGFLHGFFSWVTLSFSYLIWGHGERPARTLFAALGVIFCAAVIYTCGSVYKEGTVIKPDFLRALYLSTVTFTTVGYGDITPAGWTKLVAMIESFCGMFVMPLFIVGLSRKYLRI